jgi:hypothetical protein
MVLLVLGAGVVPVDGPSVRGTSAPRIPRTYQIESATAPSRGAFDGGGVGTESAVTLTLHRDVVLDVCPMCHAELGRPDGETRRQLLLSAVPGVFRWRCPDCAGVWQVATG